MNWEKEVPCYRHRGVFSSQNITEGLPFLLESLPELIDTFGVVENHCESLELTNSSRPGLYIFARAFYVEKKTIPTYEVRDVIPDVEVINIDLPKVELTGPERDSSMFNYYESDKYYELKLNNDHFGVLNATKCQMFVKDFTHWRHRTTLLKKQIAIAKQLIKIYKQYCQPNQGAEKVNILIRCAVDIIPSKQIDRNDIKDTNQELEIFIYSLEDKISIRTKKSTVKSVVDHLRKHILLLSTLTDKLYTINNTRYLGFKISFFSKPSLSSELNSDTLDVMDRWLTDRFMCCYPNINWLCYGRAETEYNYWTYESLPATVIDNPTLTTAVLKTAAWLVERLTNREDVPINPYVFGDLRTAYKIVGLTNKEIDAILNVHKIKHNNVIQTWTEGGR